MARNIVKPGATNIVIRDTVCACLEITAVGVPSKGSAARLDETTLEWKIDELGVTQSEGATLEFTVKHVGPCSGTLEVNEDIDYSDAEGNKVTFPAPEIEVTCGDTVLAEACPEPVDISIEGCEDTVEFDAGEVRLESLGRVLQLDVTLKRICPRKRVALAVILSEVVDKGNEYTRGLKTLTIPAHTGDSCRDITVRCIKFVLPEDLDVSGTTNGICDRRKFKARFIANYIDHDFDCCRIVI